MDDNINAVTFREIRSKEDLYSKSSLFGYKNADCKFNLVCKTYSQGHTTQLHGIQPIVIYSMRMRHASNCMSAGVSYGHHEW